MSNPIHLKHCILLWLSMLTSHLFGCTTTTKQNVQNQTMQTPDVPKSVSALPTPISSEPNLYSLKTPPIDPQKQWVQVGRYRVINAVPTNEQQDILQVMIQVTLPEELRTIQAAVEYLLERSGYEYAANGYHLTPSPLASDVQQLLSKPIPAVHRHLGPMTLQNALETLAGSPFQLKVDPIHRRLSYELLPSIVDQGHL